MLSSYLAAIRIVQLWIVKALIGSDGKWWEVMGRSQTSRVVVKRAEIRSRRDESSVTVLRIHAGRGQTLLWWAHYGANHIQRPTWIIPLCERRKEGSVVEQARYTERWRGLNASALAKKWINKEKRLNARLHIFTHNVDLCTVIGLIKMWSNCILYMHENTKCKFAYQHMLNSVKI